MCNRVNCVKYYGTEEIIFFKTIVINALKIETFDFFYEMISIFGCLKSASKDTHYARALQKHTIFPLYNNEHHNVKTKK